MLEYQLHYYETVFPWLEEFKLLDPKSGYAYVEETDDAEDPALSQHFLSPEEYASLSNAEKFQLALNRYNKRQKNNWQIGIEYERYIGYLYETQGYAVRYSDATLGLEDMGRDLIATKGKEVFVIQCKRWSQSKTIHEKHIFQLYGSLVTWAVEKGATNPTGVFYTTVDLSPTASKCAKYLKISAHKKPYAEYPMIKCNVSRNGEKIYHLPFDQQYDRLFISPSKGDRYASTVKEAEHHVFRRAYRWQGKNTDAPF